MYYYHDDGFLQAAAREQFEVLISSQRATASLLVALFLVNQADDSCSPELGLARQCSRCLTLLLVSALRTSLVSYQCQQATFRDTSYYVNTYLDIRQDHFVPTRSTLSLFNDLSLIQQPICQIIIFCNFNVNSIPDLPSRLR